MANALTSLVDRLGSQRILIILLGAGAVGVIWSFSQWGMASPFVPVATGLPIDQVGSATQLLDEAGIDVRLERGGGMVTVPNGEAARARVLLAAEGLSGSAGGPGFELFDEPAWGMTDFTQRVNYRRALEGELERTIRQMREVESVRVHLALPLGSFLRAADEAGEASIVLKLKSGAVPGPAVVEGVQSLVAGSVQGLLPESVTVLDDRGRLLSSPGTEDGVGITYGQLKVRRQIEEYLERRAESLVIPIVGTGNASVRVAAELNFDQMARTVQSLDPEEQMLMSEERSEITPGDPGQGAASVTRNTTFDATRSVETLSRGGARIERLTVSVLVSDRRIPNADGTPGFVARSIEELQRVETLVANAVGISVDRGDEITVVSAPFEVEAPAPEFDSPFDMTGFAMAAQRPVVAFAGLGMALFLSLQILGTLKALGPVRPSSQLSAPLHPEPIAPAPVMAELTPQPTEAPAVTIADPEMAARVLRSWIQE